MSTYEGEPESKEERRKELREKAQQREKAQNAQQWEPAPGEILEGEVIQKRQYVHEQFGESPLLYIEDFDGNVYSVLARHKALETSIQEEGVEYGDMVMITYKGEKDREGQPSYHDYDVVTA